MAITRSKYKGVDETTRAEFICDIRDDIASLPTQNVPAGSTAFVVADKSQWMINSQGQWLEISRAIISGDVEVYIRETSSDVYASVYTLYVDDEVAGAINIPKDKYLYEVGVVTNPQGQDAGKYLSLTVANGNTLYIPLTDLLPDGATNEIRYRNGVLQYNDNGTWKNASIANMSI